MSKSFVWGVILGTGGLWAFHRFIKPMSTNAS